MYNKNVYKDNDVNRARSYFSIDNSDEASTSMFYGNPKRIHDISLLDKIDYDALGFTAQSVKDQLLGMDNDLLNMFGVTKNLINPDTNKPFEDDYYDAWINQMVAQTEKELNIVIRPRVINERIDYNQTEYNSYMYLRTSEKPIIQVQKLVMMFSNQPLMDYPDEWIKVSNLFGQVEVQPTLLMQNAVGTLPNNLTIAGYPASPANMIPYNNPNFIPQMFGISYIAGMLPQPPQEKGINRYWYPHPDLIAYVAKKAAIECLERWGRTILGAGIAGYGIQVDGISSQINSTQSAEYTGSTADINLLKEDMQNLGNSLKAYYGINLGVFS